ncbi:MAG: cysteine--tRNA ligase [Patescibacteria group bacterium]
MIRLYNTLTRKKEDFTPLHEGHVGMYNCGPTVYDRAHIGNLRAYVFSDTLRRVLELQGLTVLQVMNITDVGHLSSDGDSGEDKMTKGLKREGLPLTLDGMKTLADTYTRIFEKDIAALNIEHPHELPRASEHIQEQIDIISKLKEKGFVYTTKDGVYFDTNKDVNYGKLGGLTPLDDSQERISGNDEKKNPRDFAVWKLNSEIGWESPWGKGFPGWHIECSAMAMKYLGESFDIHTGGIDHIPVHHNNEIAQSENATGKQFARFWIHGAFLNIDNTKISKSLGNFITLEDLQEKGISPIAYRYWLLTGHYRSELNFSLEALEAGQNAYNKLIDRLRSFGTEVGTVDIGYEAKFLEAVNDDLNTPQVIALMWDMLKDDSLSDKDKKATLFYFDRVLGLGLRDIRAIEILEEIQILLNERESARKAKEWAKADELREKIAGLGYDVKDSADGYTIFAK